jgi:Zn-dependent protease
MDGAVCASCGLRFAASLLACSDCHALLHAETLKTLAREAEAAEKQGELAVALKRWQAALDLVPFAARQHRVISEHVNRLSKAPAQATQRPPKFAQRAGIVGTLALLVWKLKFLLLGLLGKAKLLILGMGKASTFFSMLISMGAYWTAWGLPYAVGVVLLLYVHEMGHVWALRQLGVAASAPLFIPGVGAFVRLQQGLRNDSENARVGLAGPIWGAAAAAAVCVTGLLTHSAFFMALAKSAAWLNLFNLMPIWQLDGGRAFTALGKMARAGVAALFGALALYTQDGLLWALAAVSAFRVLDAKSTSADPRTLPEFAVLTVVLVGIGIIAGTP